MMRTLKLAMCFCIVSLAWIVEVKADESQCGLFTGFVDNGDGTVRDIRSGLVWKRCPEGMNYSNDTCVGQPVETYWESAIKLAKNNRFLGLEDWRLPTNKEFASVMRGVNDQHLPPNWPAEQPCRWQEPRISKAIDTVHKYTGHWGEQIPTYWSFEKKDEYCQYVARFGGREELFYSCGGLFINVRLVRDSGVTGGEPSVEYLAEGNDEAAQHARAVVAEKERIRQAQRDKEVLIAREKEKKQLTLFRKSLDQDAETNCGPVIEIKGRLVKVAYPVENYGNEHWIKRDEILPPSYACHFVNGRYQSQ